MDETKKPIPASELDPRTRMQAKKQLHEQKQKERADAAAQLKVEYANVKESPALVDILVKARSFAAYHTKLAKDGIGARNMGVDDSGAPIIEDYHLSSEERLGELDQAKGIEQIISYIEQKIA
jgi:hypothetical protein